MSYTAKIVNKIIDTTNNRVNIKVEFTDGQQTFNTPFNVALYTPLDQIKQLIRERIDEYEKADVTLPTLTLGDVDLTGTTIGTTQEVQDLIAFFKKKTKLDKLNEIKALGFLTGTKLAALDTAITDLKTTMNSDFKAAFVNYF